MRNNKIAASIKLSLAFDFAKFRARSLKFRKDSNHRHIIESLKANKYKYGDDANFEVISAEKQGEYTDDDSGDYHRNVSVYWLIA